MPKTVYLVGDHILSPLGVSSQSNWDNILLGKTGVAPVSPAFPSEQAIYGAVLDHYPLVDREATKLENMMLFSLQETLGSSTLHFTDQRLLVVISTTKGNIDLLGAPVSPASARVSLPAMARFLQVKLQLAHRPLIVSNACISGVLAIQTAAMHLRHGYFDHALVVGGDLFSTFTLSGFYAFKALSAGICKPFDQSRDGINLGEASATVLLTVKPEEAQGQYAIKVAGYASSNDANHISGPSRDGSGLRLAVDKALRQASTQPDFINAHGTGTLYNDNMESLAFEKAGLSQVPLNSLKAYYGHTLGAAGVLEVAVCIRSLLKNKLVKSLGFETAGTEGSVQVIRESKNVPLTSVLKTASGFGGCNAALVLEK